MRHALIVALLAARTQLAGDDGTKALTVDRGELDPPSRDNVVEVQCVAR